MASVAPSPLIASERPKSSVSPAPGSRRCEAQPAPSRVYTQTAPTNPPSSGLVAVGSESATREASSVTASVLLKYPAAVAVWKLPPNTHITPYYS